MAASMLHCHDVVLLASGLWLLLYRLFRGTRCWNYAELSMRCACGASLALLAPLLPIPGALALSDCVLVPLGVLLSTCHPALAALLATAPLGTSLGALLWSVTGLCGMSVSFLHPVVLSIVALGIIVPFVCVPGIAGPTSLVMLVLPTLGAFLVTAGVSGLVPAAGSLTQRDLFAASCADVGEYAALKYLGMWLLLTVLGVLFPVVLHKLSREDAEGEDTLRGGDLVEAFLPQAGGADSIAPKPELRNDRLSVITRAIFAEEGADTSHLSENERKLVAVCRKDEEERDRVLWGGGLY